MDNQGDGGVAGDVIQDFPTVRWSVEGGLLLLSSSTVKRLGMAFMVIQKFSGASGYGIDCYPAVRWSVWVWHSLLSSRNIGRRGRTLMGI